MTESFKTPAWGRGVAMMPFNTFGAFFKPDELEALNDAFDAAWQHLRATSGGMKPAQARDLQNRIAKMILASACTGERDKNRLTEIALRGVSGGSLSEKRQGGQDTPAYVDET